MTSFVHVESDNNDIFRKAGGNFNMMLIWWMYDDFMQNGWENCQKHMAELRDTLYGAYRSMNLFPRPNTHATGN